jgi:hypothetical protein
VTGSAADSITFSSLDGNTDKLYVLKCYIKMGGPAASTYSITFKPNNVTTNQAAFSRTTTTSATTPNAYSATWAILNAARGSEYHANIDISSYIGVSRMFSATGTVYDGSAVSITESYALWSDVSTNLTSIVLAGSSTGNFDVGSAFHLYKYTV